MSVRPTAQFKTTIENKECFKKDYMQSVIQTKIEINKLPNVIIEALCE